VIHVLLAIALAVFVIWLVLTVLGAVGGGLVHLLWIIVVVALAIWLFQYLVGSRRSGTR
jgi:uncharacterized RDD family membrane protein YckC